MGKTKVASTYVFGKEYRDLANTGINEDLKKPSPVAFQVSGNADDNSKLHPSAVYKKVIDGTFLVAPR